MTNLSVKIFAFCISKRFVSSLEIGIEDLYVDG